MASHPPDHPLHDTIRSITHNSGLLLNFRDKLDSFSVVATPLFPLSGLLIVFGEMEILITIDISTHSFAGGGCAPPSPSPK